MTLDKPVPKAIVFTDWDGTVTLQVCAKNENNDVNVIEMGLFILRMLPTRGKNKRSTI